MTDLLLMGDHPARILNHEIHAVGLDCETTGLTWVDKVIGVSLAWKDAGEYKSCYLLDPSGVGQLPMWGVGGVISSDEVMRAVEHSNVRVLAMANHSFDYRFLMKQYGLQPLDNIVEIQHVAHHLSPQAFGVSLAALYSKYCGKLDKEYADMKGNRALLHKMNADSVAEYARQDATKTLKVYEAFTGITTISLYKKNHYWDQKFMKLVMQMVERGLPLDLPHIQDRIKNYRQRMITMGQRLAQLGISNPNYAKDVMGYATSRGIPLLNTQVATLEELDLSKYPDLADVISYRQYSKALGSWLEPFDKYGEWDGALHSQLNPYGTRSYRMSAGDPNAQGIPMEERGNRAFGSMFGVFKSPDPELELWALDLKQAELRLAATLARDEDLLAAVSDVLHDPYVMLSMVIWNTPDKRQTAKYAMLSSIYEVGITKFAATYGTSEQEAETILKTIRARFPTAMRTAREMTGITKRTGRVDLVTGRPRWLQQDEAGHEYKAFNQFVQGSLAELMRETMLRVETMFPNRLVLQVHDSIALLLSKNPASRQIQINTIQECVTGAAQDMLGPKYKVAPFPIEPKPYQITNGSV